jgi:hypothetical protein
VHGAERALHMREAVVMFTFFGVTYLLPGLHAYA